MDVDLKACISGDRHAWDAFVDRYAGVILAAVGRAFRRRVGHVNPGEVDDPVQEVFVRLIKDDYRLLRSYDPRRASLSTWLTLVARSVAIDHLRKRRRSTVPLGSQDLPDPRTLRNPPNPPPAVSETSPDDRSLPMHLLTARQRLVLRMLFDEELSVAEAARTIGVDAQTIRSTKHKALSRLREHLSP